MPIDLNEKIDLGNGFVLSFQKHTASGNVRAVVKDCTGAISTRGTMQPERTAIVSKREALAEHMRNLDAALQPERAERKEAANAFFNALFGGGMPGSEEDEDEDEDEN